MLTDRDLRTALRAEYTPALARTLRETADRYPLVGVGAAGRTCAVIPFRPRAGRPPSGETRADLNMCDTLFGSLLFVAIRDGFGAVGHAVLVPGEPGFDAFIATRRAVLLATPADASGRPWTLNVPLSQVMADSFRNAAAEHAPALPDPPAAVWAATLDQVLPHRPDYTPDTRAELALGWVQGLGRVAGALAEADGDGPVGDHPPASTPPALGEMLACRQAGGVRACLSHLHDHYKDDGPRLHRLRRELDETAARLPDRGALLNLVLHAYLMSSRLTGCGRAFRWFDRVSCGLGRLTLNPDGFLPTCPPREYWRRFYPLPDIDWTGGPGAADVPVDTRALVGRLPTAADPAAAEGLAAGLLAEAAAGKRFSIPPWAAVDAQIGPFARVRLWECPGGVCAVFWTPAGEFLPAIWPTGETAFVVASEGDIGGREVVAALGLYLAALVRDFWVAEERVFHPAADASESAAANGAAAPRRAGPWGGRRYVYLPRVVGATREAAAARALGLREVGRHQVSGHLRRADAASPAQLEAAAARGVAVPPGFTFVRSHVRGGGAVVPPVYRSRSALGLLYGGSVGPPRSCRWQEFERSLRRAVAGLGLGVEGVCHVGRGDGVRLEAVSGDGHRWVVLGRLTAGEIGPAAVRRLAEALREEGDEPPRGAVVTTGAFKVSAVEAARQLGVRLVDGEEFARLAAIPQRTAP